MTTNEYASYLHRQYFLKKYPQLNGQDQDKGPAAHPVPIWLAWFAEEDRLDAVSIYAHGATEAAQKFVERRDQMMNCGGQYPLASASGTVLVFVESPEGQIQRVKVHPFVVPTYTAVVDQTFKTETSQAEDEAPDLALPSRQ